MEKLFMWFLKGNINHIYNLPEVVTWTVEDTVVD